MKHGSLDPVRVPQLISAYRAVAELYTPAFIHAQAIISASEPDAIGDRIVTFTIGDICHGIGRAVYFEGFRAFAIKQISTTTGGVCYSEFYLRRHGNNELDVLVRPLIESKLRSLLEALA